jgi:hypothetical protein
MAERVLELGLLYVDSVHARCDGCHKVRPGAQLTGPHGYVTICLSCLLEVGMAPDLEIKIRGLDG